MTEKRKLALAKMLWFVLNRCLQVNDSHYPDRDTDAKQWSAHAIRRQVLITHYHEQMRKLAEIPLYRSRPNLRDEEDEFESELDWMLRVFNPSLPFFMHGLEALPLEMQLMLGLTSQILAIGVASQVQSMMVDLQNLARMLNVDEGSGDSPGKGAAVQPRPQPKPAPKPLKPMTAEQIQELADRTRERFFPKKKPKGPKPSRR